jgi:hypothetical protein
VGSFDDMNLFTIQLRGTGALSEVASGSTTPVAFSYDYGSTDINTVTTPGFGSLFPSEQDFIDSVDAVFTAGDEITGSEPNTGDNVTIENFGSESDDRVRFIQMPSGEALFTKWSEEGNPFQQDQPIDSSFDPSSPNVWFKSVRDGNPIYMTYSQTIFTGAITFSR